MSKPRMTLKDVCCDLRRRNFPISQPALADGIVDGTFPFGKVLHVTNGRRCFLILRKDYESWADANAPITKEEPQ
ncbi:MAG: hypothetical protein E7466_04885 [Ruminococcaceae bacterium]|nr:hypothetical protein [Oscillospiraceae bacterium]